MQKSQGCKRFLLNAKDINISHQIIINTFSQKMEKKVLLEDCDFLKRVLLCHEIFEIIISFAQCEVYSDGNS